MYMAAVKAQWLLLEQMLDVAFSRRMCCSRVARVSTYPFAPPASTVLPQIRPGMETRITLDAFPKRIFKGKTRSISPYVLEQAKQARTVEVEVDFQGPLDDVNLLVGYSADVEIVVAGRSGTVRIASEAVKKDGSLWVVHPQSKQLHSRKIVKGLSNWQFTEVREGLAAGEQVVTTIDRRGLIEGVEVVVEVEARGE